MRARTLVVGVTLLVAGALAAGAGPVAGASLDEALAALRVSPLGGAEAPPLALERLADGRRLALTDLRGRPVLVYFWATW